MGQAAKLNTALSRRDISHLDSAAAEWNMVADTPLLTSVRGHLDCVRKASWLGVPADVDLSPTQLSMWGRLWPLAKAARELAGIDAALEVPDAPVCQKVWLQDGLMGKNTGGHNVLSVRIPLETPLFSDEVKGKAVYPLTGFHATSPTGVLGVLRDGKLTPSQGNYTLVFTQSDLGYGVAPSDLTLLRVALMPKNGYGLVFETESFPVAIEVQTGTHFFLLVLCSKNLETFFDFFQFESRHQRRHTNT